MREPKFTDNSRRIFDLRYPRKGEDGKPAETPVATITRVAENVASVTAVYEGSPERYAPDQISKDMLEHFPARTAVRLATAMGYTPVEAASAITSGWDAARSRAEAYYDLIASWDFLPNSPTWTGAGTPLGQLAACFVLPISDDLGVGRDSIFETLKVAALIQQTGGGNGFSFGDLRPSGTLVKRSMGKATGPIGFMEVYDAAFGTIAQGGSRRGANMGVMPVWHADIESFLTSKVEEGKIANFNISVALTDEFMDAVDKDGPFDLGWWDRDVWKPTKTIQARDLYDRIAKNAWVLGEPGNLFIDRANEQNPVPARYTLKATNPCFHPDTMIETVHGPRRITDITEPTEVLTKGPSGGIEVRKASASFITARDAQTVVIRLSNGRSLTVTPNHEIMLVDGTYTAAESLRPGDRVEALCQARRGSAYVGVKLASQPNRDYRMKHRVIYEGVHGRIPEGHDINHIDRDTFHNDIDNFEVLTHAEHATLTRSQVPNDHQVIDPATGRFVSGPESRRGAKFIRHLPEHLSSAWRNQPRVLSVEPGPVTDVYDITVDETHNVIADFVVAHNCGEQWLGPYENCCLGSLNLANFTDWDRGFDWDRFARTVALGTEFLDDVVDANQYVPAVPELGEAAAGGRRIGLGLMGLADAMLKLGIRYGSPEGLAFASQVTEFARFHTMKASIKRAEDRGPFGWFEGSIYDFSQTDPIQGLDGKPHARWTPPTPLREALNEQDFGRPALDWTEITEGIRAHGIRNSCQFTFAPTGTISNVAALEGSGCEPLFALVYYRTVMQEGENIVLPYASPLFAEALYRNGFNEEGVARAVEAVAANGGSCQGIDFIPESIQRIFAVAGDITWEEHVLTQAVLQRFVDNSISKTINMPNSATVEDVASAYRLAYDTGCKGITIYRQGSRELEVLSTSAKTISDDAPVQITEAVWPVIRPMSIPEYASETGLASRVFPVLTPFGKVQVTVTELDEHPGRPFDLRIQLGKAGNDKNADVEALGRSISLALRAGVDVQEVVDQLEGIGGATVTGFGPARVRSVADGVAKLLKRRYLGAVAPESLSLVESVTVRPGASTLPGADPERTCPRCNQASIVVESGCAHCDPRLGGCGEYEGCE